MLTIVKNLKWRPTPAAAAKARNAENKKDPERSGALLGDNF
ncbi:MULTISPECIES: hypothetical protein [Rhizobium]|nr:MULTISPECIES: hypothetical protein [Rhizobium]